MAARENPGVSYKPGNLVGEQLPLMDKRRYDSNCAKGLEHDDHETQR